MGRRSVVLLAVLFVLTGAAPAHAVSGVTVALPTSNAAGARTDYVIGFTTGGALSGTQTISVTFPAGTTFAAWQGANVTVGGTTVGSCGRPAAGSLVSSCGLNSGRTIGAGAVVEIRFGGIGNGAAGTGNTVSVATSADPSSSSPGFSLVGANAVGSVSANNLAPSRAAGAVTTYVIAFAASGTGGLSAAAGSEIAVDFPSGTSFGAWNGAVVTVDGTAVGSCARPLAAAPLRSVCGLNSGRVVAPSAALQLTFNGVTNGPVGTGKPVSVTTTSDTVAAAPGTFDVVAGGSVTTPSVDNASPSQAAGAVTQYTVGFATSTTGGLAAGAASAIMVDFPAGTAFGAWNGAVVMVGGVTVGSCARPVAAAPLRSVCGLNSSRTIAASTPVQLQFFGVTNGEAATGKTVTVSTTSDLPSIASAEFSVIAGGAVTQPGVTVDAPSAAAGALTSYVVSFGLSATGGLSSAAAGQITVDFPAGTAFAGWNGAVVTVGGVTVGSCARPVAAAPLRSVCGLNSSQEIPAGAAVTLTFNGVTSPAAAGSGAVSVSTTSDLPAVASAPFVTVPGGRVSAPAVTIAAPSAAAGALTAYVVTFTTSSGTGGLSAGAGSEIAVDFPAGASFGAWNGAVVTVDGVTVGSCARPLAAAPLRSVCGLNSSRTIAAGAPVQITFNGVTNGAAGAGRTVAVTTTSDVPSVTSSPFEIVVGHALGPVTVSAASSAASATTDYTVAFTTSPTGGLSAAVGSRIVLGFPAGTTFAAWNGSTVASGGRTVGSCSRPVAGAVVVSCGLNSGQAVAPLTAVQVTIAGVTNPPSPSGPYAVTATTTSDPGAAPEPAAPVARIDSAPGGPTSAPAFTFSSDPPGAAFECSVDGAPFAPCASPYAPAGLAGGAHTFAVRAVGGSPVSRAFTVAAAQGQTPTPTPSASPSPSPSPAPTPVPGKSVVGAPVSGKVLVKKRGAKGFVELDAAEGIPLGSTVDAKRGAVTLTARAGQTATFSAGIFKVTQSGKTTDLTLTEPLAKCGAAKASAAGKAKKKAKSRKLWGDGKGRFRTRGQYSAATVRGTKWLVQDSCAGTLTKVTRGAVSVRDNVKKKTVVVKAGRSYRAKPPRRR